MKAYPAYKESGVEWLGEVPEGWEVAPIKAVASCNDEVLAEITDPLTALEYVEISGVDAIDGIVETTETTFAAAPSRARRIVRDGDVLISTVRTYLRAIAQVTEAAPNLIASTGFAVLRPQSVSSLFLGYVCRSEYFIAEVIARSVGVSCPAINASQIIALPIPLPPLPEQQAIAAFLDRETAKIDGLIEEQRRLIALLAEKRQATISHAVTRGLNPSARLRPSGVDWLGDVPEGWEMRAVKTLVQSIEQGWSPQCEAYPADDGEWGVLKVGCVNGGIFRATENKALPPSLKPEPNLGLSHGDILVSRANTRELVGSVAMVVSDFPRLMLCDKLYRLRNKANDVCSEYLALALQSQFARREIELAASGASASMVNIAQSVIMEMKIPVPPLSEQMGIIAFLMRNSANLDALTETATTTITLLQERRAALISAAVTGKIDVRDTSSSFDAA